MSVVTWYAKYPNNLTIENSAILNFEIKKKKLNRGFATQSFGNTVYFRVYNKNNFGSVSAWGFHWSFEVLSWMLMRALGAYSENFKKILSVQLLPKLFKKCENSECLHKNSFGCVSPWGMLLNYSGYVEQISGSASYILAKSSKTKRFQNYLYGSFSPGKFKEIFSIHS